MVISAPADEAQYDPDPGDIELGRLRALLGDRFRVDGAITTRFCRTVYSAFDTEIKREVAIKVIAFEPDALPDLVERLERQLRRAAELGYRGVMPPTHMAVMDGGLFYVTPYAAGGSALDVLLSGERLSTAEVQLVVREVAEALARAHARGVVHGSLTPGNILFGADGHPRVADFGITDTLIDTGFISGAMALRERAYAPPEQWRGARASAAADQFSLAVIAYELLTGRGRLADPGADGVSTLDSIDILASVPLGPEVPLYMNEALRTALSASPANRFATIMDFAEAFEGSDVSLRRGLPTHAAPLGMQKRPRFRPPYLWLILVAAFVAALDPGVSSAVRLQWTAFWESYSPPEVKVKVFQALDEGSTVPVAAVTSVPHSRGDTPSWLDRLASAIVGNSPSAQASAQLRVEVDRGTALVLVDGIPRGTTPLLVSVGAGHHVVSVTGSSHYDPPIAGANVAAGDTAQLSFRILQDP